MSNSFDDGLPPSGGISNEALISIKEEIDVDFTSESCACSEACTKGEIDNGEAIFAKLDIDQETPLYKGSKLPKIHFVVPTSQMDWAHDACSENIDSVQYKISQWCTAKSSSLLDSAEESINCSVSSLPIEIFDIDVMRGLKNNILILPHFLWINNIMANQVESTLDELVPKLLSREHSREVLCNEYSNIELAKEQSFVFICSHRTRDKRCGITAPILKEIFDKELQAIGLYRDNSDFRPNGVKVAFINHVGGHKFAANVLIYLRKSHTMVWLGRVTPKKVSALIKNTIMPDKPILNYPADLRLLIDLHVCFVNNIYSLRTTVLRRDNTLYFTNCLPDSKSDQASIIMASYDYTKLLSENFYCLLLNLQDLWLLVSLSPNNTGSTNKELELTEKWIFSYVLCFVLIPYDKNQNKKLIKYSSFYMILSKVSRMRIRHFKNLEPERIISSDDEEPTEEVSAKSENPSTITKSSLDDFATQEDRKSQHGELSVESIQKLDEVDGFEVKTSTEPYSSNPASEAGSNSSSKSESDDEDIQYYRPILVNVESNPLPKDVKPGEKAETSQDRIDCHDGQMDDEDHITKKARCNDTATNRTLHTRILALNDDDTVDPDYEHEQWLKRQARREKGFGDEKLQSETHGPESGHGIQHDNSRATSTDSKNQSLNKYRASKVERVVFAKNLPVGENGKDRTEYSVL